MCLPVAESINTIYKTLYGKQMMPYISRTKPFYMSQNPEAYYGTAYLESVKWCNSQYTMVLNR